MSRDDHPESGDAGRSTNLTEVPDESKTRCTGASIGLVPILSSSGKIDARTRIGTISAIRRTVLFWPNGPRASCHSMEGFELPLLGRLGSALSGVRIASQQ